MWWSVSQYTWRMTVLLVTYLIGLAHAYVLNAQVTQDLRLITCWTCPNKTNNAACNNWAPERHCPANYTICQTIHRINMRTGQSLLVNKRCALPKECTMELIGCHDTNIPGVQDCISCCNYAYCNEQVPFNYSTALLYSSLTGAASSTVVRWYHTTLSLTLSSVLVSVLTHGCRLFHR